MALAGQPWTRRLAMPLAVLAVAGAVAIWSSARNTQRSQEIHAFVLALCDDVVHGRAPPRLGATDPLIAGPLISSLEAGLGDLEELTILVARGDLEQAATLPATHTATIAASGAPVLGLRIAHHGSPRQIAIIGFWRPSSG